MVRIPFGFHKTITANTTDDLAKQIAFKGRIVRISGWFAPVSANFLRISVHKGWTPTDASLCTQIFPAATGEGDAYIAGQDASFDHDLDFPIEAGESIVVRAVNPDTGATRSLKVTVEVEKNGS